MNKLLFGVFAILVCQIGLSYGWGAVGHKTVAAIAQNFLNPKTVNGINDILAYYKGPNGKQFANIIEIATYADEIKSLVPWANAYHYVNLLDGETVYNEAKHCPGPDYCIIASLNNYTKILKDASIKDVTRLGEALSFTVHFMGDIFQPLHVGNLADRGGNGIKFNFSTGWKVNNAKSSDLHSLWDTQLLLHWMNTEGKTQDSVIFATFIDYVESDSATKDKYLAQNPDFNVITTDSRVVVNKWVYNQNGFNYRDLPVSYFTQSWPIKKLQIIKSGLQLAKLLNNIFSIRSYNGILNTMLNAAL